MKERIEKLIEKLDGMRNEVLVRYLDELVQFSPEKGGLNAIERANILHDTDRHISNLWSELARMEAANKMSEYRDVVNITKTNFLKERLMVTTNG